MPKPGFLVLLLAAASRFHAWGAGHDPAGAVSDWYAGKTAAPISDSVLSQTPIDTGAWRGNAKESPPLPPPGLASPGGAAEEWYRSPVSGSGPPEHPDIGAWYAKPSRTRKPLPKQAIPGNEIAPWYGLAPYRNPSRPAGPPDLAEWFGRKPAAAKTLTGLRPEGVTAKDLAAWKGSGWPDVPYPASSPRKARSPVAEDPEVAFWLGRGGKAPRARAPERAPDLSGWFAPSHAAETPGAGENHARAAAQDDHHAPKTAAAHESAPEDGGHGPHAGHGDSGHGTGHEPDAKPALSPQPDTGFARALDWEQGYAEVLDYAVRRPGPEENGTHQGRLTTERIFLKPDGTVGRRASGQKDLDVLNATLAVSGQEEGAPFSVETVAKLPRREAFRLLRQDQSLQGAPGNAHRSLDCQSAPPRLRTVSSGAEPSRDTVLARWPVYTEEMLFTYLRAVPQRIGYREEVWLQDWGPLGRLIAKPRFAAISVRRKMRVRDLETYYITVDRDDGRRSEFWVSSQGLHPVAVATLADRTQWTLRKISRLKSQAW